MPRKPRAPEPEVDPDEFVDDEDGELVTDQAAVGDIALLNDDQFEKVRWSIWRYRTDVEMRGDNHGEKIEYVGSRYGAIDAAEFQKDFGGGTFDLRGYVDRFDALGNKRGVMVKYRPKVTVAGPRKNFAAMVAADPAAAAVLAAPTSSTTDALLRELLQEQRAAREDKFERILHALVNQRQQPVAVAPATPPISLTEIIAAVQAMKQMTGGDGPAVDPVKLAHMVMEGVNQGIVLGQSRDPVEPGQKDPDWMPVIERTLEIVSTMMRQPRARPPMPGQPQAPPREPSGATVVPDPAQPEPPSSVTHRWVTAIESVYRGMARGTEPELVADALSVLLNPEEFTTVTLATVDQVVGAPDLQPVFAQFQPLTTEAGKAYLGEVLEACRKVGQEEAEPASP